eukprot:EG_transcript_36251
MEHTMQSGCQGAGQAGFENMNAGGRATGGDGAVLTQRCKPHCRGDRGAVVGGRYGTVGRGSMSWQHSVTWAAGSTSNRLSGPFVGEVQRKERLDVGPLAGGARGYRKSWTSGEGDSLVATHSVIAVSDDNHSTPAIRVKSEVDQ